MTARWLTKTMALFAAGVLAACGAESGVDESADPTKGGGDKAAGGDYGGGDHGAGGDHGGGPAQKDPQLNLSHIECKGDVVEVHFVLLHFGDATPPDLEMTWTDGDASFDETIEPGKHTGNVWHYTIYLPSGYIKVTAASVGDTYLHNPEEYTGDYQCNGNPVCEVVVEADPLVCIDSPLGNPEAECGYFGLSSLGKDDDLSGSSTLATMDAYVAIVKDGRGACAEGEQAYRVYVNVQAGDTLEKPMDSGDISHVTYCECPQDSGY